MSKLWEDLKKNMKEWSNVAVEKAEEVSKMAVAKTEELTKISKIKIEVHQLQKDLDSSYSQLGHWIESQYESNKKLTLFKDNQFQSLMEAIQEKKSAIAVKETEIQKIREEAGNIEESLEEEPAPEKETGDEEK